MSPAFIEHNLFRVRHPRQPRHGHDFTADHHDKTCTCAQKHFPNRHRMSSRRATAIGVCGETVLGFSHTDRQVTIVRLFPFVELIANFAICQYFVSAINALSDRFYFFKQAQFISL